MWIWCSRSGVGPDISSQLLLLLLLVVVLRAHLEWRGHGRLSRLNPLSHTSLLLLGICSCKPHYFTPNKAWCSLAPCYVSHSHPLSQALSLSHRTPWLLNSGSHLWNLVYLRLTQTSWSVLPHSLMTMVEPFSLPQVWPSSWVGFMSHGWPSPSLLSSPLPIYFLLHCSPDTTSYDHGFDLKVTTNYSIFHKGVSERPLWPQLLLSPLVLPTVFHYCCNLQGSPQPEALTSSCLRSNPLLNAPCTSHLGCNWKSRSWKTQS